MKNKWLKWAKNCNKENAIEDLIKWLKLFYKSNDKEKNMILVKLHKENKSMYNFVNDLRNIEKNEQEKLYNQLRGNFV